MSHRKASELHRRIKLIRQFAENDQVKIVLSIDCAAALNGIQCDLDSLLKLAGLKRNDYSNKRQRFEQFLNLAKKITLQEVCAMLELNDTIRLDAEYLLGEYKRKAFLNDADSVALFMAMAVYQTCKYRGIKVSKTKLCALKGMESAKSSWKKVEDEWTQWMQQETPLANRNAAKSKRSPSKQESNENGKCGYAARVRCVAVGLFWVRLRLFI